MNMELQACGLIVILLLFTFYRSQKTLGLFREKVFAVLLYGSMTTLFLDILSVCAIHYQNKLPLIAVETVIKVYLVSILFSSFCAFFYVASDTFPKKECLFMFKFDTAIMITEATAVVFTPLMLYPNDVVYGNSVKLTYLFTLLHIFSTIMIGILFLGKINRRRMCTVISWMGMWIISSVIQIINCERLLIGFACALGIVIPYVMLESPEANIDRQFNCFNFYAFEVFCRDRMNCQKHFALLEISPLDKNLFNEMNLDPVQVHLKSISRISRISGVSVFKNVDDSVFFVSENADTLKLVYEVCLEELERNNIHNQMELYLFPDNAAYGSSEELAHLITFARHACPSKHDGELIRITDEVLDAYHKEARITEEIKSALKEDRIVMYYQPIYSMKSGLFETAEALVRIRDRQGELISPGVFIPIAEKTGLIVDLGYRIFEKVCEFISQHDLDALGIHYIEVNLSVVQCERPEIRSHLNAIMRKYGVPSSRINFEITETASIKTRLSMLDTLHKMNHNGSSFSLDDFGKGESNLIYLIDMPVSLLKLDYDLTNSYNANEKAPLIIRSVINLAHSLGISVVVEGIETEEDLAIYREIGVDYIQGYYFSRPLPTENFLSFISDVNRKAKPQCL